ncbi:FixH family protein [Amylibacter sp. SFDW26]|uniref:FixH family protein n=1 Tax=Amylibacter sp. SFDW26 TaxID=2652722 RepID=UPI0012614D57|nr:FixH family protein [Amylibacter sp. SFDW26]KAB7614280.1 FixH family protein [Amylibacter sp. SFDW26]
MNTQASKKPLTGRKVALMFVGAFITIIGANTALVYSAFGTFPGLETRQPYIEAQSFEARRIAQEQLNWTSLVSYKDGRVVLSLTEIGGATVVVPEIKVRIGKATGHQWDRSLTLDFNGKVYSVDIDLPAGNWQVQIHTMALDGTDFRRTLPLLIKSEVK